LKGNSQLYFLSAVDVKLYLEDVWAMRRVLIVDGNKESSDVLTQVVSQDGYIVQSATDTDVALHRVRAWKPHLVLFDYNLLKAAGVDLIAKVRALTSEEYTSIVFLVENLSLQELTQVLEGGGDDFIFKPFRNEEVSLRIKTMLRLKEIQDSLRRAHHRIEELSSTDDLCGLMNMRALYRRGEEEIVRARRFRKPVSALLINLDAFSDVNQSYGFVAGSHVLQEVALRIKQCVRSIDLVARMGADEFFVLLLETDLAGAEFVAERIRDAIQSVPFKSEKQSIKLTGTLGVAGLTPDQTQQKMSDLLHIVTEALKSAKANGNNRIEVYSFT
jgi:two-component system cell cycle response regulator